MLSMWISCAKAAVRDLILHYFHLSFYPVLGKMETAYLLLCPLFPLRVKKEEVNVQTCSIVSVSEHFL